MCIRDSSNIYQPHRLGVGDRLGATSGKRYKDHKRRRFDELIGKPYGHLSYNDEDVYLSTVMPDARPQNKTATAFDLTTTTTPPPSSTSWVPKHAYNTRYADMQFHMVYGDDASI